MKTFAVIRTRGAAWEPSSRLEGQLEWDAHARFMDDLEAKQIVALAGPLEGTPDVLLIVRANSPEEALATLEKDPWTRLDLLRHKSIMPWTIRIGVLPERRG
jgi:uncharacterized protein YciI